MSIIDPRTGNPLTAEPAPNTHTPTDSERPTVTREEVIIELNAGNIQQVLEASMQVPVLLDCWAPWCEPCKNLMPVLEKLAVEYGGAFLLATLDVEANPEIAGQLGVRSVPDVKLVSQGGLVDSFQGALPEKEVREWLNRYFPAPGDAPPSPEEQAEEALSAGDAAGAREIYQTLIGQYRNITPTKLALPKRWWRKGVVTKPVACWITCRQRSAMQHPLVAFAPASSSANRLSQQKRSPRWVIALTAKRSTSGRYAKWPMASTTQAWKLCWR